MRRELLLVSLLVLLTAGAFSRVTRCGFVDLDDDQYVTANPHVQQGVTGESVAWAFTTHESGNWHPLTWLSLMLDHELFGLDPRGYHLTNLALHLGSVGVLFLMLKAMTRDCWRSGLVAAVFAVHPLRVESVAWIAERKDVLGLFLGLLAIGVYVRHARAPGPARLALVALPFALSLLAKPLMVTLPFLLLLLDYWPLCRWVRPSGAQARPKGGLHRSASGKRGSSAAPDTAASESAWERAPAGRFPPRPATSLLLEKIPLLVLSATCSLATFEAQRRTGAVQTFATLGPGARVANALVSTVRYLGKMVWFKGLAAFYPYPGGWPAPSVLGAALLLLAVTALVLRHGRRQTFLVTGWLWYLGALVPMLGLVQVGEQAMADRYSYLPSIGLLIFLAGLLPARLVATRSGRIGLGAAAAILLSILCAFTWRQIGYWSDSIALFTHALEVTDGNYVAHNNLGVALAAGGRLDEAVEHYAQALRISPRNAIAHNSLAMALARQGKMDEAMRHYSLALGIRADSAEGENGLGVALVKLGKLDEAVTHFRKAVGLRPDFADARLNLGVVLSRQGELEQAAGELEQTVRLQPHSADARVQLGRALSRLGRTDEAIVQLGEALRIQPTLAEAHSGLALALARRGNLGEAMAHWNEALRIDPGDADAHYNMGLALAGQGNLEEAAAHWAEALRFEPSNADAHYNLAVVLAQRGETDEAIRHYEQALRLHPGNADAQRNLAALMEKRRRPGR